MPWQWTDGRREGQQAYKRSQWRRWQGHWEPLQPHWSWPEASENSARPPKTFKPKAEAAQGWQTETSQKRLRRTFLEIILDGEPKTKMSTPSAGDAAGAAPATASASASGAAGAGADGADGDVDMKTEKSEGAEVAKPKPKQLSEPEKAMKLAALEAALKALGDHDAGNKGLRKSLQAQIDKLAPAKKSAVQEKKEQKNIAILIESISNWIVREEKRLEQLAKDIEKAQAALIEKKANLEKEKTELEKLRATFLPPVDSPEANAAAAAAAEISKLEKQELQTLREWRAAAAAAPSGEQEELRAKLMSFCDEIEAKRRKVEAETATA